jgi:hypothetical protein
MNRAAEARATRDMTDLETRLAEDHVALELDEASFPRTAIYAAAFAFIDRCWVRLVAHPDVAHPDARPRAGVDDPRAGVDGRAEGRIAIVARPKVGVTVDLAALGEEMADELRGQAWAAGLVEAGRSLTESVVAGAFGAPGSDLDALLGDEGAFEDPLGIALSWEEKYQDKGPATPEGGGEG